MPVITIQAAAITADQVKAEAQRRIIALTGATTFAQCMVRQLNALMRAQELTRIEMAGGTLTTAEATEAAALQALADAIKLIRAKSNEIEAMSPIPTDYTNDAYWQGT